MRPRMLIGVVGTHTEVGKTWATARIATRLRELGLRVAVRKPVQSFESGATTDAEVLAAATQEAPRDVCPAHRSYPLPLAPPMAADALNRERITLQQLIDEFRWPSCDIGFVETVGGALSPLAHDGTSVDLLKLLHPDRCLLVADAGLGAINAIRLTLLAMSNFDTMIFLNRFDATLDVHRRNLTWLTKDGLRLDDIDNWARSIAHAAQVARSPISSSSSSKVTR